RARSETRTRNRASGADAGESVALRSVPSAVRCAPPAGGGRRSPSTNPAGRSRGCWARAGPSGLRPSLPCLARRHHFRTARRWSKRRKRPRRVTRVVLERYADELVKRIRFRKLSRRYLDLEFATA